MAKNCKINWMHVRKYVACIIKSLLESGNKKKQPGYLLSPVTITGFKVSDELWHALYNNAVFFCNIVTFAAQLKQFFV